MRREALLLLFTVNGCVIEITLVLFPFVYFGTMKVAYLSGRTRKVAPPSSHSLCLCVVPERSMQLIQLMVNRSVKK